MDIREQSTRDNETNRFFVSVLVVNYNPDWKKLKFTLSSIIAQRGIDIEIVIADDGSENSRKKEIMDFFRNKKFANYKLVFNEKNNGTVHNVISGLKACNAKWVKGLGPGDALLGRECLKKWVEYCETKGLEWSFSDAVYYQKKENNIKVVSCKAHPIDIIPYLKGDFSTCRWNYVVHGDIALGAAIICKTKVFLDYCFQIANKVLYAEDNVWRLMMFDGIQAGYFPNNTILYEYGEGISTSGDSFWMQKIRRDWDATTEMIIHGDTIESLQKKMVKAYKLLSNKATKLLVKGRIKLYLKNRFFFRRTISYLPEENNADQ